MVDPAQSVPGIARLDRGRGRDIDPDPPRLARQLGRFEVHVVCPHLRRHDERQMAVPPLINRTTKLDQRSITFGRELVVVAAY